MIAKTHCCKNFPKHSTLIWGKGKIYKQFSFPGPFCGYQECAVELSI